MRHLFTAGISLRTQLYSLVVGIALVAFIGSTWVSINTTRTYLNDQMKSHAQDAANSVGLSISPYMAPENLMIAETMITAIFDSGYYQSVILYDTDNYIKVFRENDLNLDGVPHWFIKLFALVPPMMSSEVSDGWQVAGTLSFKSHVGSSYQKLWSDAVNNVISSLLILFVALFIAHLILRAVLSPLAQVEAQALSVSRKNFTLINKLPVTRELKNVISAMNIMVANTQASFDQVSKQANKLTHELFLDELTQLGNRRAFNNYFEAHTDDMHVQEYATLGLVQLHSLQRINTDLGYAEGDEYVLQGAEMISQKLIPLSNAKLYRVGGGSFFFMLDEVSDEVLTLCEQINASFTRLNSHYYADGFGKLVSCTYTKKDNLPSLMAKLDTLLTQESSAMATGDCYESCRTSNNNYGLLEWRELIDGLVKANNIAFTFQPVVGASNRDVLYFELFSQFLYQGEVLANNQLYSMAERTNKSEQLDTLLITQLARLGELGDLGQLGDLSDLGTNNKVAINLTHQSLHSSTFRTWFNAFYQENKNNLPPIVFEVNEEAILAGIDSSIDFIQSVKALGIEVCIDRFGASFTSFKYLKGLDVDYLKIDGAYVHDLENNNDNKHFIQMVTQIAHSIGIKVLASHVESADTKQVLAELACDGMQGNYIQKTLILKKKDKNMGCNYSPLTLV